MPEGVNLVSELAVILIAAGVFTVISKALKQPLILGYIIAGFVVGPHLGLFKEFSAESVKVWSDLGIIFLLFALGLEFSFKKLVKVGSSALIVAGCLAAGMFTIGMTLGDILNWSTMESVFLGGMMSMSSTTIIIKAYSDMGLKQKPYASLVFGTLVVEDMIAILLMVLLSTMAVSQKFAGGEMLLGLGKLLFFLILSFLVGIYVIPSLMKIARKYLNEEILLLVSIGLCFAMVALANYMGFSSALGAFLMGSILAETIEGEKIEHLVGSIKDLFGAIFFVSVGMMVDPAVIGQYWPIILLLTVVVMLGIIFFGTSGALLAGKGLDNAVHAGFSLAQLGEFSFIIAGLGCSLGVLRDFIYPVIIAVSVITTFTTPYMIKLADPVYSLLMRKLPQSFLSRISPAMDSSDNSKAEQNEWKKLLKKYFIRLVVYGVILLAITTASSLYLNKLVIKILPSCSEILCSWICVGVTLLVMLPFLIGIAVNSGTLRESASKLLKAKASNRWPLMGLILLRILIAVYFVVFVVVSNIDLNFWGILLIALAGIVVFIFARGSMKEFRRFEDRFFSNLNQKDELARQKAPISTKVRESLKSYDVHIEKIVVSSDFEFIGQKLRDMPFRKGTGVNIVKIQRGTQSVITPSGDELVYPGDVLIAVGSTEQLSEFRSIMQKCTVSNLTPAPEFEVERIEVKESSVLAGKTLRQADIRKSGCTIISVLQNNVLHTNPSADFCINPGDSVWIAGAKKDVQWFK